ncbi:MAG: YhdH/YhfP family quinone oxidoreductase [Balneolaceae bacterium]|nr:YhdH/YhfP family quinone oxidoreductase [Balneolaceae bacterium]MBO6545504.1 YhdH/YhfP family quinone oxidoreductase [Balneolaceae bacterium]MBO6646900.1 YhdH/YhfP family quinone oxidoreductase [Balneolaceae bacterium]
MSIPGTFKALFAEELDREVQVSVKELPASALPEGDVMIKVHYSSLNYKDALSAAGRNRVTKNYPHIPGIDASGIVLEDTSGAYQSGQKVIVTGYDLGTNTFGGFGGLVRVPKEWVVSLPESLSLKEAMIFGTAGFTAMYGIERLKRELITPGSGQVLVTGATGGVGSLAVYFLSKMGYEIVASTRKEASDFLKGLGASKIISSDELMNVSGAPLLSRKWSGTIETVGGKLLDSVLRQTQSKGAVACCGNILGMNLNTNVLPFILRGISLLGIDSAFCERTMREHIWQQMAYVGTEDLPREFYKLVTLEELTDEIDLILNGNQMGRVIVQHSFL